MAHDGKEIMTDTITRAELDAMLSAARAAAMEEAARKVKSAWLTVPVADIVDADVMEQFCFDASEAIRNLSTTPPGWVCVSVETKTFSLGQRVEKISGASWRGKVVGTYSTALTPEGYAVESENEPGSVQIYPAKALRAMISAAPGERSE